MCGIFCLMLPAETQLNATDFTKTFELINRRGPDFHGKLHIQTATNQILFYASVLRLQGAEVIGQPITYKTGCLLFNGDIYQMKTWTSGFAKSDTLLLLKQLSKTKSKFGVLSAIQGPFAVVYYDQRENRLYFGRDRFGRRSLLMTKYKNGLVLSSVAEHASINYMEVPATGLFCLDLNDLNRLEVTSWTNSTSFELIEHFQTHLNVKIHVKNINYARKPSKNVRELEKIPLFSKHPTDYLNFFLNEKTWCLNVSHLKYLLSNSIQCRVIAQPNEFFKKSIAILFSGGLDCTIIAALTHQIVPETTEIHLFNVAFEKNGTFETPDRKTGLESWKTLEKLYPKRSWNFHAINVTREELDRKRNDHLRHLIYPLRTILDESLGCALWFAMSQPTHNTYRVVLVGMGADELFGGYLKHRKAYERDGYPGLKDSLTKDWEQLPYRNLGRDDRVISDHGKQVRTPYLDEDLVEFVRDLEPWKKCFPFPNLPQGVGDKLLLRLLGYSLGLGETSFFPKRALQFGSRIAIGKENGADVSPRLGVF